LKLNNTVELEDGSVTFQGTLDGVELNYVIETGLNYLMYNNLLPIAKKSFDLHIPEEQHNQ
jgi:hypothetical protein